MILARACLGILLYLDHHIDGSGIENFPLARYAAENWPPMHGLERFITHQGCDGISLRCEKTTLCRLALDMQRGHMDFSCMGYAQRNLKRSPYIMPQDSDFVTG